MRLEELPVGGTAKLDCGCRIERLMPPNEEVPTVRARIEHACRWNKGRAFVSQCNPDLEVNYDPLADELEVAFA